MTQMSPGSLRATTRRGLETPTVIRRMKGLMFRFLVLSATVFTVVLAAGTGEASAHRSGCHRWHSCPSDHHTYPWHGLWCTSYSYERLASDRIRVTYGGRVYWCHR